MRATLDFQDNISILSSTSEERQSIVLDTGSAFLVSRQPRDADEFLALVNGQEPLVSTDCLYLLLDGTVANFTGPPSAPTKCLATASTHSLHLDLVTSTTSTHAQALVGAKLANQFQAENWALHNMYSSNGTFGLSYCTNSLQQPLCNAFRDLLKNSTGGSTIMSLDFQSTNGSLYLGGVPASYNTSMVWAASVWGSSTAMHQFMMKNLNFGCGASSSGPMDLLARYGSVWPAVIDTG
jgi:hypothetical protein